MSLYAATKKADELITAMNRAAEAAVPEAKTLLVNSIKQMSVEDAKGILTGVVEARAKATAEYVGKLVSDGHAEWHTLANGDIQLRFRTGETFLLGETMIVRLA